MSDGTDAWQRACLALDLLATNPSGLRGLTVRARAGPVRDAYVAALSRLPQPLIRLHPAMSRDALLGGMDLAGTLSEGRIVRTPGLLEQPGTLVLAMAERCPPDLAAILAAALDNSRDLVLILLDEGAEADEHAPLVLTERLAFQVALDGIGRLVAKPPPKRAGVVGKDAMPAVTITALTTLAARLGIDSLRAPTLACTAAMASAALNDRDVPTEDDIQSAAELVLAHRATQLPEPDPEPEDGEAPEPPPPSNNRSEESLPEDMLIEAVRAVLPADVLENLRNSQTSRAKGSGAGQRRKGNRRGRPIPSRPGRLGSDARLDLVATLRAAAPWQTIRGKGDGPVRVYPSDVRLRRYEEKSDRLLIFSVDASGSAALARLAEAKGAVELLLSRAYAARDHVALISFRGTEAQLLLPPTRSLVQTKRRLAGLPGGGGTPLAAGLKAAAELALHARSQGLSPTLAILTDGRANIALDGTANRTEANADSTAMAHWIRAEGLPAVILDLGTRPQPALAALARAMDGRYLPLPRADAARMSDALGDVLDHGLDA